VALISSRNLAAPLTNKIHITTIILVALLFAVFRLAGGGVDVKSSLKQKLKDEANSILSPIEAANDRDKEKEKPPVEQEKSDVFSILENDNKPTQNNLGKVVPPWQRQQAAPQKTAPKSGTTNSEATSLDDIRRMLNSR
jgi:hypothetical protein